MRLSRRALLAALVAAPTSAALGRTPLGGTLRISLPLTPIDLDPHALDDPLVALFGDAIFDALFGSSAAGTPYPTLAAASPRATASGLRVELRPGLLSARGKALTASDVVFSLERARRSGAGSLLAPFGRIRAEGDLAVSFDAQRQKPETLAETLASPFLALLPRGFSRLRPDGTGAFRAELSRHQLRLRRNARAARGPAFLDEVTVSPASNLADALRAFESGESDIGWLGKGLHRPRPRAIDFSGPSVGWVVLRSGNAAGRWGAPGVVQSLLDGLAPERLAHLGLKQPPRRDRDGHWGGPVGSIMAAREHPQLVAVAQALSAALATDPGALPVDALPRLRLREAVRSGRFMLAVDFVRKLGSSGQATAAALLGSTPDADARRLPRHGTLEATQLARTLPLGIVGELMVRGARLPDWHGLATWDLGAVWRAAR